MNYDMIVVENDKVKLFLFPELPPISAYRCFSNCTVLYQFDNWNQVEELYYKTSNLEQKEISKILLSHKSYIENQICNQLI